MTSRGTFAALLQPVTASAGVSWWVSLEEWTQHVSRTQAHPINLLREGGLAVERLLHALVAFLHQWRQEPHHAVGERGRSLRL